MKTLKLPAYRFMKKNNALKKAFKKMLESGDFSQLQQYDSSALTDTWSSEERKLLAELYNFWGHKQLEQGSDDVVKSFEKAARLDPKNPHVIYQQAEYLSAYKENPRCLELADKALQQVTALSPAFLQAWSLWGVTLMNLGIIHSDPLFFREAHQKYAEAEKLALQEGDAGLIGEVHFQTGFCWYCEAVLSGEPCDFLQALASYKKAASCGFNLPEFWNAYGDALAELGCLLSNASYLGEAINHYQKVIANSKEHPEAWLNLACTTQKLYEADLLDTNYEIAYNAFRHASENTPEDPIVWLKWGQLLLFSGKVKQQEEKLINSLQKFSKANACSPGHPKILSQWAEALLITGITLEKIEYLKQAQDIIIKVLKNHSEQVDYWCIYGCILNELGLYFSDESFFHEAIEKFTYGLRLQEKHFSLLHGLSLAYYAIGDLNRDTAWIEKAVACCTQVAEDDPRIPPQFWNDWGVALLKLAELTHEKSHIYDAIEKFEKAIDVHNEEHFTLPLDPQYLYNYGCALDFLGDLTGEVSCYEKAIQVLTKTLQLSPSYSSARYNLALAYSHLGELVAEIECFIKSLDLFQALLAEDKEDEMAWNDYGLVFIHYAQMMEDPANPELSQSLYEQAEHKFLEAAALGCTHSYYNLACLYCLIGKNEEALHYLEKAETAQALPGLQEMLHDEWLEGLRHTGGFREFIFHLSRDQSKLLEE